MLRLCKEGLPPEAVVPSAISLPTKVGQELVLGRGSNQAPVDVQIALRNNEKEVISRRHLRLVAIKGENNCMLYRAEDLGSLNGVFVNGIKILTCVLQHGDTVQLGGMSGLEVGSPLPTDGSDTFLGIKFDFFSTVPSSSSSVAGTGNNVPGNSKKRSLMGSSDSMQHIKKMSPPIPSLLSDNFQKQNALYQEQLYKQQLDIKVQELESAKQQILDLNVQLTEMTENISVLTSSESKNHDTIESLRLQIQRLEKKISQGAQFAGNGLKKTGCSIDVAALRSAVNCPLCSSTLIDAVVMKCSHGFCRSCLELHLSSRPLKCLCPCCNDAPPKKLPARSILYMRSANLDMLIFMLNEAGSPKDNQVFLEREKLSRATLIKLGLDPDSNEGVGANQIDDSQPKSKRRHKNKNNRGEKKSIT